MRVPVTPGEWMAAEVLGTARRKANEIAKTAEHHFSADPLGDDIRGVLAELAFAKHHNVYPDLGLSPRAGSADMVINGVRVDVKAVVNPQHRLIAPLWKKPGGTDVYVLGVVGRCEVNFIGWCYDAELICDAAVDDIGHGDTYVRARHQLRSFASDLRAAVIPA